VSVLGVLGKTTFEVSADKVRTWRDAKRRASARWAKTEVYQGKPVSEFVGPGLDAVTLTVRLDIDRGVSPKDELRTLRDQMNKGDVLQFTVGGELIGDFKLEGVDETWTRTGRDGVLEVVDVSLALEEYK